MNYRPGQILLTPSYLPPDNHLIRVRVRVGRRAGRLSERWGRRYQLEAIDPHPHRFITRTTAELSPTDHG